MIPACLSCLANYREAVVRRDKARGKLTGGLLSLFGGRTQPVLPHLAQKDESK
jgi:hypothetical protein